MHKSTIVKRCLRFAAIGALPGLGVFPFNLPTGIGLIIMGSLVGAAVGLPDFAPGRTVGLFFGVLASSAFGFSPETVAKFVDDPDSDAEDAEKFDFSQALVTWLVAEDVPKRRTWIVATAIIVGLASAYVVTAHDLRALEASHDAWFLPISGWNDPPETQANLLVLGSGVWAGVIGGLVASAAFRRLVFVATGGSFVFGACMGLMASWGQSGVSSWDTRLGFGLMMSTVVTGIAWLAAIGGPIFDWWDNRKQRREAVQLRKD